jgi:hypothetical protein
MAEQPTPAQFKAEMPQIPGVGGPGPKRALRNPMLPLIVGLVVVGVVLLLAVRWLSRSKPAEAPREEQSAQIEVPPPPPDPAASLPHATEANPAISDTAALAKPWSSQDFFIRNHLSGENIPATIVRLPTGSPAVASGYWAFSRKAPFGSCELEYIADLNKLRTEYEFKSANHPLVGNPCTHTLYDPLKTTTIPPDNAWTRGAIVQGSDLRPPLGVEIKIQGKEILAIRSE